MKYGLLILMIFVVLGQSIAQDATEEPVGDMRTDDRGVEQVYVPAGCFMMGTSEAEAEYALELNPPSWAKSRIPSEQPQHEVCITRGYWIDTYEVTNAAFQAFVEDGGYTTPEYWSEEGLKWLKRQVVKNLPVNCIKDRPDDLPVVCVTWYEAEAYAKWRGGSLPTEAQWEYAARGADSPIYPWGNEWQPELANVEDSEGLMPVGSYPDGISWVGAYDMAGNAMEWAQDWLDPNYYQTLESPNDPPGPEKGTRKVEKGGWWGSNAFVARSAYKHFEDPPTYQDHHIGFRIVSAEE